MNFWTPCDESQHCYYQIYHGKRKCCNILNDKDGGAPFKDGECPFYKSKASDFSGGRRNAGSSEKASREAGTAEGG